MTWPQATMVGYLAIGVTFSLVKVVLNVKDTMKWRIYLAVGYVWEAALVAIVLKYGGFWA